MSDTEGKPPAAELFRNVKLSLPLYAPESAWNQTVTEVAVDSDNELRLRTTLEMLVKETGEGKSMNVIYVNHEEFTIPIFPAKESPAEQQDIHLLTYGKEEWPGHNPPSVRRDDRLIVPGVPAAIAPVRPSDPGKPTSDGHLVVYDKASETEYDFYQATTEDIHGNRQQAGVVGDKIVQAGAITRFHLKGLGAQLTTQDHPLNSARASGLPLLAGLILPEDIEAIMPREVRDAKVKAVGHALAFALPRLRCAKHGCSPDRPTDWVYPASKAESKNGMPDQMALAAGERVRLKDKLYFADGNEVCEDDERVAPITRIFFQTLREYGAYLVDASGSAAFYAEDVCTGNLDLGDDFVAWLSGRPRKTKETAWQTVINALNEQLSWELSDIAKVPNQALPLIAIGRDGIGNIEVVAPASTFRPSKM